MNEKSINDPVSPFPDAGPGEQHGNVAVSKHADEASKLERFCRECCPEGESEGFSAPSPDAIKAAGQKAGLSGAKIQAILALVEKFGPQILALIPQILALLPKTPA